MATLSNYGGARTTPETLPEEMIQTYRRQGFIHIPGVISPDEAAEFHAIALDVAERLKDKNRTKGGRAELVFMQLVNV
jgi:hypothetical protein